MVFKDLGFIDFEEPFTKFRAHGLLISEGTKMSKSRGNVVIPDEYIKTYGADTLRCYLMFLGPFDQGGDFRDTGMAGMWRFLNRVWRLVNGQITKCQNGRKSNLAIEQFSHLNRLRYRTIKEVTEDMENLRYNTALAHIMEYVNQISRYSVSNSKLPKEAIETLLLLLAPFAPHMTEELWQQLHPRATFASIHQQPWPKYNKRLIKEEMVTIVVEVNGKVRDKIQIENEKGKIKKEVEKVARESEKVSQYLAVKKIRQVIFVPGKLINFVVN